MDSVKYFVVLEFESELMCLEAQFIADASGIFIENAAGLFFFTSKTKFQYSLYISIVNSPGYNQSHQPSFIHQFESDLM